MAAMNQACRTTGVPTPVAKPNANSAATMPTIRAGGNQLPGTRTALPSRASPWGAMTG